MEYHNPKHAPPQFTKLDLAFAVCLVPFALIGLCLCAVWGAIWMGWEKLKKKPAKQKQQ